MSARVMIVWIAVTFTGERMSDDTHRIRVRTILCKTSGFGSWSRIIGCVTHVTQVCPERTRVVVMVVEGRRTSLVSWSDIVLTAAHTLICQGVAGGRKFTSGLRGLETPKQSSEKLLSRPSPLAL